MSKLIPLKDTRLVLSADSRILVIGTIGAGKSHVIRSLVNKTEAIQAYTIDDFRREYGASSESGEATARQRFLHACSEHNGVFEFTGVGPLHEGVKQIALRKPFNFIIRVHAPSEVCIKRISTRNDWPPYPSKIMPDLDLINAISIELDKHGFDTCSSYWKGQPVLHVSGVEE